MARKRFNFWLDDKNQSDWHINELITKLKKQAQFTRAIREGLRLWVDLRANRTDVLFELFPNLKPQLTPTGDNGTGGSDLAREIAEQLALISGAGGYVMKSAIPTSKPKPAKTTAPPKAEIKQAAMLSADAIADNFLSMFD